MEVKSVWNDQIPEKDGQKLAVNDIAFSPDGTRVIAAVGNRVLLYRASDGDLIDSLRGHKDTVYCVSFSSDGSRFASGGADNVVVIWKSSGQGLLKYTHSSSIQKVKYNPSMLLLASCSETDFGLWTPDQKQVTKEKVNSRILSASWSSDGSLLALGLLNGVVTIRNQQAEEVLRFERKAPIWCLAFVPEQSGTSRQGNSNSQPSGPSNALLDHADNLVVGAWDKTYSLYRLTAKNALLHVEKRLPYYPLSIHCVNNAVMKSSYMIVAGSNKQIQVLSREGVKLADVTKGIDSWIWSSDSFPDDETMVYGTHSGYVDFVKMSFNSVHSLYRDRYAYRENLTEVIVHHLVTEKKVRIKCKDLIHNLSLYRNKLAVQLLDRICIYESSSEDSIDIHFRLKKERIILAGVGKSQEARESKLASNLMVATAFHVFVSMENVLEMYSMEGQRQKLWKLDHKVNVLRVDGGPEGHEGVLVGLADGTVLKVFVDNPFPIEVTKRPNSIAKLDVNVYRTLIATVDSDNQLAVTDVSTQETLFTLPGVKAACFNTEVEDLLCITNTNNSISVVSGLVSPVAIGGRNQGIDTKRAGSRSTPEMQEQHLNGVALGFRGQRIFSLYRGSLTGVDVPQGSNMQKALDNNDFQAAYKVACLGATEAEWRLLAMKALRSNQLIVAKNAFARLKDTKYLSLIENINRANGSNAEKDKVQENSSNSAAVGRNRARGAETKPSAIANINPSTLDPKWMAEIMAYEGHYHEAAKILARSGRIDDAIAMFTLLRKWEDAKTFARNSGTADIAALTAQQAKWMQEIRDWKGASELFTSMGQFQQAAKIIGEHEGKGWHQAMIEVVRACPVDDVETLTYCGEKLGQMEDIAFAKECFIKAKDFAKLMSLYVQRKMWNEAAKLADEYQGKFDMSVFLSYAEWLVSQDRYEEAMEAFKKCGRLDLSRKVLTELTNNAVAEKRFKDAGYYYWMLAKEIEQEAAQSQDRENTSKNQLEKFSLLQSEYEHKADLYHAYASIHSYVTDPFTSYQPEMLFQVSRFIINSLGLSDTIPAGISKASTLYTLAKQAMQLGAFKLARNAFDRLSKLQIPERKMEEVELDMLLVQAKPVRDEPEHLPVCYRCGTTNPLLNPFTNRFAKGDVCTNCGHNFVRSFINFDILPLVEFVPEPSISDEEAIDLIRQPPRASRGNKGESKWRDESHGDGVNVLSLNNAEDMDQSMFGDQDSSDSFSQCLNITLEKQKNSYTPVQVDVTTLVAMKRAEVFVCKPSSKNKRATFYKNMLPDIPIAISQPCHRFFHLEDFEFAYLSEKKCPYSRLINVGEYGSV